VSERARPLVRAAVVVVAYVVAGAAAGVLWEWLWDPPPGLSYQGEWFLDPAGPDVSFEGIALFVLIAFPLGVVLAVLAGIRRGHEVATVLSVLVAAGLSGIVMYAVGTSLGPGDPQALAAGTADYTSIDSDLDLTAPDSDRAPYLSTALVALPAGAMTGLVGMYLFGSRGLAKPPRG
jgi:Kef-type K+ transport system membrane component KefB